MNGEGETKDAGVDPFAPAYERPEKMVTESTAGDERPTSYEKARSMAFEGRSLKWLQPVGEPEADEFAALKDIVFKGGPFDGEPSRIIITDADGHLYFFRNNGRGEIEQCVYRIALVEREKPELKHDATPEEEKAWTMLPKEWDWVGEFVGKRRVVKKEVSGVRKNPSATGQLG